MGKIKNFMDKPITVGGYLKLCTWSVVLSAATIGASYVYNLYKDREYYKDKCLNGWCGPFSENPEEQVDKEVEDA